MLWGKSANNFFVWGFFLAGKNFLRAGKIKILEKIDWTKCKNTLPAYEWYMRDIKKAIFRYERLSMCFIVLLCTWRSPKIQYGVYPFVLVPFRLPVSYRIESLYPSQKKGGLPRLSFPTVNHFCPLSPKYIYYCFLY